MGFRSCHPGVQMGFFAGALILCALAQHPLFQATGFVAATVLYLSMKGSAGWKLVGGMGVVMVALALVNPLFNAQGHTVLFTYLGGRPYTLQGLAYGASTALMFASILMLFASYALVMTSDRFTFLFGSSAPALTLVLTMVLRLIPNYLAKASQVADARRCIGRSPASGTVGQRIRASAAVLSALISWALEGAVVTADSMRSRGYGTGERTSYARYRFDRRDGLLAVLLAVSFSLSLAYSLSGDASVRYLPSLDIPPFSPFGWAAFGAFALFMFLPAAVNGKEAIAWRFSLSRI